MRRAGFHPLSCSFSLLQETKSWLPRAPVTNGSPWTQSRTGRGLDAPRISLGGQRTSWKESGEEKKKQERRGPLSVCDDGEKHKSSAPFDHHPPTLPHGHHQRPQLGLLLPGQPGLQWAEPGLFFIWIFSLPWTLKLSLSILLSTYHVQYITDTALSVQFIIQL